MITKKEIRKQISECKKKHSEIVYKQLSIPILERLQNHPRFKSARTVLVYHSLPDEVYTHDFLTQWHKQKRILLPVVVGRELEIRLYQENSAMQTGAFGIQEPVGSPFTEYHQIDLIVVPGVAFDCNGNRLGRGKGYYDRLFKQLHPYHIYKLGICFDFQKLEVLPVEIHDVAMDEIL